MCTVMLAEPKAAKAQSARGLVWPWPGLQQCQWSNRQTWRPVGRACPISSDFLGLVGQNTLGSLQIQVGFNP